MRKQFAVFGLGVFGTSVAIELERLGCEVLVVDSNEDKIQEISDHVSYAIKADLADQDVMKSIGARNLDGAIVAISENMEASVMATIMAKESGIPYVISKALTELQGKVLKKVGADLVIYPEKEMGVRVARGIVATNFAEWIDLSPDYSLVEFQIPAKWVGKSLIELKLREKKELNIVGVICNGETQLAYDPNQSLPAGAIIIAIGPNVELQKLKEE